MCFCACGVARCALKCHDWSANAHKKQPALVVARTGSGDGRADRTAGESTTAMRARLTRGNGMKEGFASQACPSSPVVYISPGISELWYGSPEDRACTVSAVSCSLGGMT